MERTNWMIVIAAAAARANPADGGRFYAGKTISMSTHTAAGGGYDTYLRLLARHWNKHIPGKPTMLVINQPGAGGLLALNYAGRVAPKDGTFLTLVSQASWCMRRPDSPACRCR